MDFAAIDAENTIIISASRRQARFLREQYAQYQIEQGHEVWQSLKAMPWSAFVNYCWELAQDAQAKLPVRLSQHQSQYLWQEMVAKSDVTQSLLNSKQTQKLSQDAWRLCQQWQIKKLDYLPGDQDQAAFERWYQEYQQLLTEKGWVDSSQQPNVLLGLLETFVSQLPATIITYGFQQPTPQQQALINALQQHKTLKKWALSAPKSQTQLTLYSLPSPEQELLAAVRWAKDKLIDNSEQSIAIVVPELDQWRRYIERLIQREFYASDLVSGKESTEALHDFSIDEPLLQQPIVAIAMDWLALTVNRVTKQQLQHLLLSPYLYQEKQQHWHATELELVIRQSTKAFYTLQDILKLSRRYQVKLPWVELAERQHLEASEKGDLKHHISVLLNRLAELHWTGYHSLSSREYQVQQTLIEAIKSAQVLQKVLPQALGYKQAVGLIKQYLEQQSFHQQTPKAPLQIMGVLEAIGLNFDAVWMVGATDQVLPQKAVPNPFLSKTLHVEYQLPGSSHTREVEYAQSLLDSLLSNQDLTISYAEYDGEQQQMMSPLLQPLRQQSPLQKLELATQLPEMLQHWQRGQNLEYFEDNQGSPIVDEYDIRGGTGLLRMQAASPFDAYLKYRLQLEPFEVDGLGISFLDRGNLFHKAMQIIWDKLKDQQSLLVLSEDEQKKLINKTLDLVLSEVARKVYLLNNDAFLEIEKKRLEVLIHESLALDKEREPFSVIGTEQHRKLELAGLNFSLVIDRIDQLEDGRLLIIDYKTGQPRLASLFNDPIAEPQLLMYAISEQSEESPVAGILFMQAHLKASKYIGITEEPDTLAGVKALKDIKHNPYAEKFEQAIEQWRAMLEQLALDFKQGKANLTEYSGDYVDYLSVNRWAERDRDIETLINDVKAEGESYE